MKPNLLTAIHALLQADDSIDEPTRLMIMACCREPYPPPAQPAPAATQPERLLSPQQVSAQLAVSVRTVQRWLRDGSLPSKRLGSSRRIPASALERLPSTPWITRKPRKTRSDLGAGPDLRQATTGMNTSSVTPS